MILHNKITNIDVYIFIGNTKQNPDGTFTCQHGVDECISDVYELCTLYKLSGNISSIDTGSTSLQAFPFIQCIEINEGNPTSIETCYNDNLAVSSKIPFSEITKCYETESLSVQKAAQLATPSHDYVPWVLVDHNLLDNTELLQNKICSAYTGPKPVSCRLSESSKSVCLNKW